jgi:hypothetical protein
MPRRTVAAVATIAALAAAWPVSAQGADEDARYRTAIERTKAMVGDQRVIDLAARQGLDVLDVTWEDTGRFLDSSVGPNISDMTIQVQTCDEDQQGQESCQLDLMPVLRFPNYSDKTGDVPLDRFSVLVGNEQGQPLRRVSLADVLGDLRTYLHDGDSWGGSRTSLLAPRDSHALVSAQAAFLPVPRGGVAEFNPVLFNYQSVPGDPAVLTLLATREGTSVTVIDNVRDGFQAGQTWGQRLFFNQDGERASLTGTRLSDSGPTVQRAAQLDGQDGQGGAEAVDEAGGLNMVLLVQVPLKQKHQPEPQEEFDSELMMSAGEAAPSPSDVEAAVIGHGKVEGPFTELDGLDIERDERYPIRVTVQFYKATETGEASAADLADVRGQIDRVYDDADYVGSLVLDDPHGRPTEHDGPKVETPQWWLGLQQRLGDAYGWSVEDVRSIWARLRG